jgi:polyphosphate kinase
MATHRIAQTSRQSVDATDAQYFINRELSWLAFNWRVLEEALDDRNPLLERVKFLAIFASNLDEFFMIRVSGLRRQLAACRTELPPDGLTPAEQLAAIRRELLHQLDQQAQCWQQDLAPKLTDAGMHILNYVQLDDRQRAWLRDYFEREVFPVLTPLAFDPAHPFPHISNLSLNLAVVVDDPRQGERFARVKVPDSFPRLLALPEEDDDDDEACAELVTPNTLRVVWLEEVVAANLDLLFPGVAIKASYPFRITRDADLAIEEDEADDLLLTIEESVEMRDFGSEVRLEVDAAMPNHIRDLLVNNLNIAPYLVYTAPSPLGMAGLMALIQVDRPDLKYPPFVPAVPPALTLGDNIFSVIRQQDMLLYHPYSSFNPVVDFIREAARDPQVLAIKQTLYRVGANSPVVDALMEAREQGKQVAVLVELKARFDEENNIAWARALEQSGVHVAYGLLGLKTHAKICLVVRREPEGIVRYVHMSTGNYNPTTSKIYTDLGYFTCDPDIGADISDLFNALTGYANKKSYRKLLVAPGAMRDELLARIDREIQRQAEHGDGYLAFKLNALVDQTLIRALYRASQAGVRIDLQVRGICCLRPGIPGVSERITVTSIVGRFLEHARIFYFRNGGDEDVFLGSADLMPRNLDRRVEILFPVTDTALRRTLIQHILVVHLKDNSQARRLLPDGRYERQHPLEDEPVLNSQLWMLEHRGFWE